MNKESNITGLYGRCPHCNSSVKAKATDEKTLCDNCNRLIMVKDGEFVAPGAATSKSTQVPNGALSRLRPIHIVIGIIALVMILCAVVSLKPVYCPIHNVAMQSTGKIEEIPPLSGHLYETYACPQGHEIVIDKCPSCTSRGDDEFQEKEIERRLK